jgi:hypothetical protein
MANSGANYDPTFVQCTGFGQNTSNAAPSLFVESIAIDLDCSVYGSLFVTKDGTFGENVTIQMNLNLGGAITAAGSISSGGNGNFSGVVAAAGGFVSGNPMRLPGASIGGALNKFSGSMDVAKSLNVGGEIVGPLMQAAEKIVIGPPPEAEVNPDNTLAEIFFNQERYTAQPILDATTGRTLTVLAVYQNPDS